jgi:hypothetical protein
LEASPGNSFARPYLEKTFHKNRAGAVAQDEGPEFKPQYRKKKKKKNLLLCVTFPTLCIPNIYDAMSIFFSFFEVDKNSWCLAIQSINENEF